MDKPTLRLRSTVITLVNARYGVAIVRAWKNLGFAENTPPEAFSPPASLASNVSAIEYNIEERSPSGAAGWLRMYRPHWRGNCR